jgi:hypothetical protein
MPLPKTIRLRTPQSGACLHQRGELDRSSMAVSPEGKESK